MLAARRRPARGTRCRACTARAGATVFAVQRRRRRRRDVEFGDGEQGARLPTGRGNVTATYRVGGGTRRRGRVRRDRRRCSAACAASRRCAAPGRPRAAPTRTTSGGLRRLAPTPRARFRPGRLGRGPGRPRARLSRASRTPPSWNGAGRPGCACGGSGLAPRVHPQRHEPARARRSPAEIDRSGGLPRRPPRRDRAALRVRRASSTAPHADGRARRRPAARPGRRRRRGGAAALADPDGAARRRASARSASRSTAPTSSPSSTASSAWSASPSLDAAGRRPASSAAPAAARYELLVPSSEPVVTGAPA